MCNATEFQCWFGLKLMLFPLYNGLSSTKRYIFGVVCVLILPDTKISKHFPFEFRNLFPL